MLIYGPLQAKMRELERKYELQAIKHEELTLEMTQLRVQAERYQMFTAFKWIIYPVAFAIERDIKVR